MGTLRTAGVRWITSASIFLFLILPAATNGACLGPLATQIEEDAAPAASEVPPKPVEDAPSALELAIAVVGGEVRPSPSDGAAERVVMPEDQTPFLSGEVTGRPAWRCVVEGMTIKGGDEAIRASITKRRWEVYLDANRGHVIRVVSCGVGQAVCPAARPAAAEAEVQIQQGNGERHHAFAEPSAIVPFAVALERVAVEGVGTFHESVEIEGLLVVQSEIGVPSRPVWMVSFRGASIRLPKGPGGYLRNIIEAKTGRWLHATTRPKAVQDRSRPRRGGPPD